MSTTERPFVAVIVDPGTGETFDHAWTWETGQNYAQQGYVVTALADDGFMAQADAQALYEAERARFIDCFGRDTPFDAD